MRFLSKFLSFWILFLFIYPRLGAQVVFSNPTPINLPDGAPPIKGSPYGSQIDVSGMSGIVSGLTVTLYNVYHNLPSAMDILLVAPDGSSSIILSDVGSAADIKGITVVLKDDATNFLPDTQIHSGTYKPTNLGYGTDTWPAPAPASSGNNTLSVFNGMGPNGVWKLYAVNDIDGGSGTIQGGWSITMTTQNTAVLPLRLKDFSAVYSNSSHSSMLTWTTAEDAGQYPVVIASSSDGIQWKEVSRVTASAINGWNRTYHFEDRVSYAGKVYYRLKFSNSDGSFFYSKVIEIISTSDVPVFSVFPVPARTTLHINCQTPLSGNAMIRIVDITGRIRISKNWVGASSSQLDIHELNSGQYFVKINDQGREIMQRIIIDK